ncbi:DNA repair protein RAD4 isoform X2 [Prosopis cineraria]|uniref:DNA repair protein RAD4 isoform X2 n=1 Tax=Prosopis cineraria TaxID=364024 RepID=UPI00240FDD61|nr:DNA repair protein RAD4 isoform X2 [Prosopis cineraria]
MRSRGSSKRKRRASSSENETRALHNLEGMLDKTFQEAGAKFLSCADKVGSSLKETDDSNLHLDHSIGMSESERNDYQALEPVLPPETLENGHCSRNVMKNASLKEKCDDVSLDKSHWNNKEELDDSDWEEGSIAPDDHPMTIELNVTPDLSTQKRIRRASAQDKGFAELVHKVHLLCLLSRGRLIDKVCDDPLIQASLLSLLPEHLIQLSNVTKLTSKALHPLVAWFHNNFRVKKFTSGEMSFHSAVASALETREGSFEEVAALSVALFRALNLTTRFVSILDVASLKPGQSFRSDATGSSKGVFNAPTVMVSRPEEDLRHPKKLFSGYERENSSESSLGQSHERKEYHSTSHLTESTNPPFAHELNGSVSNSRNSETEHNHPECLTNQTGKAKRKGDLEFEMQLEMALSATAIGDELNKKESCLRILNANSENSPSKRIKRIICDESLTFPREMSTAVGPMKFGSPLYWAEVYCGGENLTGKWVHIDTINLIIDGEHKVESMAAACKTSLRYVLAFAGQGAKDVTRRYCTKWHKIASQRVNSMWWDSVLAPLRELESGATEGVVHVETNQAISAESRKGNSFAPTRSSLEDIELQTRALTEPLPTNQQAYRSHPLYAIEKWLTKYQVLHPKGPILGFCSGLPVYPRTCVQTLKTKGRWLREGLQVKSNEHPAKLLKSSVKHQKVQDSEADDYGGSDSKENIEFYGKWQLEPLNLPHAVNGIVPKNERGQVEVWSEKCLPPGTVHLRFPKAFAVAKRLEIDYASAMVGFEFKNGRSHPVFDGIVVCAEFKDVLLEAYAEEEERTRAEARKRDEAKALSRWYQLLSSIVTRQRLNNRYNTSFPSETSTDNQSRDNKELNAMVSGGYGEKSPRNQVTGCDAAEVEVPSIRQANEHHEHVFLKEYESFDEESSLLTKRCQCGFSVQVEEL